ncbi:MAG: Phosphotransferase enzyme family protein [Syntrophus sp. PtaU1.Bin208]|nr:MAG: Phosphotransferase enzyme family protein [Syntrophus sp. PtaU1.Bin208]
MNAPGTEADLHRRITDFALRTLALPQETPLQLTPIAKGGSDRMFYRLSCRIECEYQVAPMEMGGEYSVIVMHYNPGNREDTLYAEIADFLLELKIAAPTILAHDSKDCLVVMEDLGTEDLWSYRNEKWITRRGFYVRTLMHANRLHRYFQDDGGVQPPRMMNGYDMSLYRWERQYFREEFVGPVCGISLSREEEDALEEEGAALARRLMLSGEGLIHRDLQSQNIMIHELAPVLIDFQGMRKGSPFYDLGSLLYDPYVSLTFDERLELLGFYYILSPRDIPWEEFATLFYEGSAQRLMQALGAYGFLGLQKGKAAFLAHIPNGLRNLQDATSRASALPHLRDLATRCLAVLKL